MHRRRDVNRIDLVIHQKVVPVRRPPPRAKLTRERVSEFGSCSADCYQLAERRVTQSRSYALSRDVATTNQSPPDFRITHRNFSHSETIACSSCSSSEVTPTRGGRTGPPLSPTMSIIVFIVDT